MRRRDFLKSSAVCAAGIAGALAPGFQRLHARAETEPGSKVEGRIPGSKLKLSCAAYSFRKELSGDRPKMTLEDFVDFCAREGLEACELTSYYFRRTDREYLTALRRRAYVNGLAISGTPVGNNFCLPPGPKRANEIEHVKTWIDHVAVLGSQTIRVFAGGTPKGAREEDARKWAVECLKEVSEYAGRHGILLALENHGGITRTAEGLLSLVEAVRSPWLGVNLDTGNFHTQVYESIERAAPYAVAVQVKVEVREEGKRAEEADFARIVRILRRAGYRGYLALEYEAREPAPQAVPKYLAKLRRAIEEA